MESKNFQIFDRDLDRDTLYRYLSGDAIAVDTETMGLLPQRDRLCLVQLCNADGLVSVIRMEKSQSEAENLKYLMESEGVVKVFHYARFDVAQLYYHLGIQTTPIFCTKIASKIARTYTNNHGLKNLVLDLEGIELDKSSQSSDWGNAANLSEKQLSYAANDVRYLLSVQRKLIEILEREERLTLALQCFGCIPVFVSLDLLQYQDIFAH